MMFGRTTFWWKTRQVVSQALLEVIEGWSLLAPTASTRSMSGFCAAVDTYSCVCYTYIQHQYFGIHTENTAHVRSTLRLFCIADRYQVSGIRCSILLILAVSRSLPVLRVECDNARKYASCSRSNFRVYCKLLSVAMPYAPLLLLCCCWRSGWVCTAAATYSNTAAAMPATTPAAAVADILAVVSLLLSFSCAGEALSSAQAPLEVGTARRR